MKKSIPLVLGLLASLAWGQSHPAFKVVAEPYPPYEFIEDGRAVGWDLEMVERAAKRAGLTLVYEFVPWARAEAMVRMGTADAIMSLRRTPEREAFLWFGTTPLGVGQTVILAGPGYVGSPTTLEALRGVAIGVSAANSYGATVEAAQGWKRVVSPDQETLLRRLADGSLPLAVMNGPVAQALIAKHGFEGIRTLPIELERADLFIAFSKASPRGEQLFHRLDKALQEVDAAGELADLRAHYGR